MSEEEISQLYRLPLDEFTPERDALAKRLRKEKRRDEADAVKRLRRPTAAAWAINQLAGTAELLRFLEAADALAAASPREWRAAGEAMGEAADAVVARAREHPLSDAAVDHVRETLQAVPGDPELRELVAAGRLDRERQAIGFGGLGALGELAPVEAEPEPEEPEPTPPEPEEPEPTPPESPTPAPLTPEPTPPEPPPARSPADERRARAQLGVAERRLADAERAVEEARARLEDAVAEVEAAELARDEAAAEVDRRRAEL